MKNNLPINLFKLPEGKIEIHLANQVGEYEFINEGLALKFLMKLALKRSANLEIEVIDCTEHEFENDL